jgi:hypothetical protein
MPPLIVIVWSVLFVVVGLLLFGFASHAALKELGRAMMWSGLFALSFALNGHTAKLF